MSETRVRDQREAFQTASQDLSHLCIEERLLIPAKSDRAGRVGSGQVAVVGAGPAGLIAANLLAQLGYQVTVFERLPQIAGMLAVGMPVDRRPQALMEQLAGIVCRPGIDVQLQTAIGRDLSFQHLQEHFAAILLAVGAEQSVPLGIPGETMLDGVIPALQFLQDYQRCPHMHVNGEVAVIGGGWATIDAARLAVRAGAHSVRVFLPGTLADLPARPGERRAAQEEGVLFHPEEMPTGILGTEDATVHGLRCQKNPWEPVGTAVGRMFRTMPETNYWYLADAVLVALGERPDLSFSPQIEALLACECARKRSGEENVRMLLPGVCAAGDMATTAPDQRTVLRALSAGYEAAHAIHRSLCPRPAAREHAGQLAEVPAPQM